MASASLRYLLDQIPPVPEGAPILLAGPTASGKSALAMALAERYDGVIVNADASQIYDCWRVVTARPSSADEASAPHALYGHVAYDAPYSAGHWLREVRPLLSGPRRVIITGGTGLYFNTLTRGMADIPATPPEIRAEGDALSLDALRADLDTRTARRIDLLNRARVQRAWEVLRATGRPLADWQDETPPPVLNIEDCLPLVLNAPKDWLLDRITRRFDQMVDNGAVEEVSAMHDRYDPTLPACKAIGVPELMAYVRGEMDLDAARQAAHVSTRQFAKRQRTWFRSKMSDWIQLAPQ